MTLMLMLRIILLGVSFLGVLEHNLPTQFCEFVIFGSSVNFAGKLMFAMGLFCL